MSPGQPLLVSVLDAAAQLGVSPQLVRTMIRTGELPHRRLGDRVLVPTVALKRLGDVPDPVEQATEVVEQARQAVFAEDVEQVLAEVHALGDRAESEPLDEDDLDALARLAEALQALRDLVGGS